MQFEEYKQLRAYTRYDGVYLAILWLASFACTVMSSLAQILAVIGELLILATPFFVAFRLKKYREDALSGHVSFSRALLYCLRVFFDGAIIFAILQWLYMKYLDGGRLATLYKSMMSMPEMQPVLKMYGLTQQQINETLEQMLMPSSLAFSSLTIAIILGGVLSVLIAAIMKR